MHQWYALYTFREYGSIFYVNALTLRMGTRNMHRPACVGRCQSLAALRSCDVNFAPAMRKSHLRSSGRRCVFKTQLRFQNASATSKRICDLHFAGAIFISQVSPITSCWLGSRARRARASQMTMCRFTWRVSLSPRHRCVRCIMTSLPTTVKSHENTPNIEFSYPSLGV